MNENESFRERALKRAQSHDHSRETSKKRKVTSIILIIDAIAVIIILFYFSNRSPEGEYSSTSFQLKGIEYRFSIAREGDDDDHTVSLSLNSTANRERTIRFHGSVADVHVRYGDDTVTTLTMGENVALIALLPGENKTFIETVSHTDMKQYITSKGDIAVKKDTSIFSTKEGVPFTAVLNLNTGDDMSTSLRFWHRI